MEEREQLEKIDLVKERTGLSFVEAKILLEEVNWDVVEALVRHETQTARKKSELVVKGSELVSKVKELIHQGNVTNIRIKARDRVLLDIPINAGIVASLLAPQVTLLAALATLFSIFTVEVERREDGPDTARPPHA